MELTTESIQKIGGFTGGPVKREVEWEQDGETLKADVWIRPLSYHTTMADAKALKNGEDLFAYRLSQSVCHKDGTPVFRICDITGINEDGTPLMTKDADGNKVERGPLRKSLSDALIALVNEVSGLGKTKPSVN